MYVAWPDVADMQQKISFTTWIPIAVDSLSSSRDKQLVCEIAWLASPIPTHRNVAGQRLLSLSLQFLHDKCAGSGGLAAKRVCIEFLGLNNKKL
jgi:hypothetical protein